MYLLRFLDLSKRTLIFFDIYIRYVGNFDCATSDMPGKGGTKMKYEKAMSSKLLQESCNL